MRIWIIASGLLTGILLEWAYIRLCATSKTDAWICLIMVVSIVLFLWMLF